MTARPSRHTDGIGTMRNTHCLFQMHVPNLRREKQLLNIDAMSVSVQYEGALFPKKLLCNLQSSLPTRHIGRVRAPSPLIKYTMMAYLMSWSDQNYVEQTNYYMHSHDPFSLRALPWTAFAHPVSVWWDVCFFSHKAPPSMSLRDILTQLHLPVCKNAAAMMMKMW